MASGICISKQEIIENLQAKGKKQGELHKKASCIRDSSVSKNVYFRGIIEFSNICANDCFYCGIRKSNNKVKRYLMSKEEILECVEFCDKAKYGSIVLQSGELQTKKFTDFVTGIVKTIKKKFPKIGITLCVGEQSKKVYQKFFDAGARRYLLRIETSNKEHYSKLHPNEMSFESRKKCLENLKKIGFQTGTGVMIGSPFQTTENLADDLLFFKKIGADMMGMGPYVLHEQTPFSSQCFNPSNNLNLSLNMVAMLRLMMPYINIASTTALQALTPNGRELGLQAGANVIMPIVTPKKYREDYQLYKNKPCINESSEDCMKCIIARIKSVGLTPAFGKSGTSLHFLRRKKC